MKGIHLRCDRDGSTYDAAEVRYRSTLGEPLDVVHDLDALNELTTETFDARLRSRNPLDRSGVWRFRELIAPIPHADVVTRREGNTGLYNTPRVASWVGLDALQLKHEGENPTGSFKDRGMTAAISLAKSLGMSRVACASTGNTSAAMAAYAAQAGMQGIVFIPDGKIAYGKLSQALAYGARTLQIEGDFDDAMTLVQEVCDAEGIYLVNSINPFRIEGQKAIGFEILQDLGWVVPDWIVLPGGNLGNNSAIAKGMQELYALGLIDRLPRIAVIQASGANPLFTAWTSGKEIVPVKADTLASAIKIGAPVSWRKSLRGLAACDGIVAQATDQEILDAKAQVDAAGIGAEPASCATVAGIKMLVEQGVIAHDAHVVGVLTGHLLKDPDIVVGYHQGTLKDFDLTYANAPTRISSTLKAVQAALGD
ncbi:MAG: threonine synthase [Myxococcota bacterium]|jgi:threonine synthase